ncbi:hypothetical protein D3C71_2084120 [compost metagenome]
MILYHAIGMEHIRANLAAPGNVRLLAANLIKLLLLFLQFPLIQLGTQHFHRLFPVLDLRAFVLAGNNHT